jgi:hypothetical protein
MSGSRYRRRAPSSRSTRFPNKRGNDGGDDGGNDSGHRPNLKTRVCPDSNRSSATCSRKRSAVRHRARDRVAPHTASHTCQRSYASQVKGSLLLLAVVLTAACAAEPPTPARTPTPVTPTIAVWSPPTVDLNALLTGSDPVVLSVWAGTPWSSGFFYDYPTSVGSRPCVIFGGGPARFPIPAVCRTEVEKRGSNYVVNLTQVWDGADYHGSGQLHHTWSFLVADTGEVMYRGSFGDGSPGDER